MNFGHVPCDDCRHLCLEKRILYHLVKLFGVLRELQFERRCFGILSGSCGNCPDVLLRAASERHSRARELFLRSLLPDGENGAWAPPRSLCAHAPAASARGTSGLSSRTAKWCTPSLANKWGKYSNSSYSYAIYMSGQTNLFTLSFEDCNHCSRMEWIFQ